MKQCEYIIVCKRLTIDSAASVNNDEVLKALICLEYAIMMMVNLLFVHDLLITISTQETFVRDLIKMLKHLLKNYIAVYISSRFLVILKHSLQNYQKILRKLFLCTQVYDDVCLSCKSTITRQHVTRRERVDIKMESQHSYERTHSLEGDPPEQKGSPPPGHTSKMASLIFTYQTTVIGRVGHPCNNIQYLYSTLLLKHLKALQRA